MKKKLLGAGFTADAALIFFFAAILRIVSNLFFHLSFGPQAIRHTETWLYRGVMSQTHAPANGLYDVTTWLLYGIGAILPGDMHLGAVEGLAVLFSSLTAAFMYLALKEVLKERHAMYSALTWSFLVDPIALSTSGFTHDMIQFPLMWVAIYLGIKACKKRVFILFWALLLYLSHNINESWFIVAGASLVIPSYELILKRFFKKDAYKVFSILSILGLVVGILLVAPLVISPMLSGLPQGRLGSDDVLPSTVTGIWLKYNILIPLCIIGLWAVKRNYDVLGPSFLVFGLVLCTQMSRGTRVLDFGFAIIAAGYLANMDIKMPKFLFQKRLSGWGPMGLWLLIVTSFYLLSITRTIYHLIFLIFGFSIYALLRSRGKSSITLVLVLIALNGISFNVALTYSQEANSVAGQTEYDMLKWLGENNIGGSLLTSWDHGYMAETISGLDAVSTPNWIDKDAHRVFWMPQELASIKLRKRDVRYVMVSSENFNIVSIDSRAAYQIGPGLLVDDPPKGSSRLREHFTIYKMRFGEFDRFFMPVKFDIDPVTGVEYEIFEVLDTQGEDMSGCTPVATVYEKMFGEARFEISLSSEAKEYVEIIDLPIEESGVFERVFCIGENVKSPECTARVGGKVDLLGVFC